MTTAHTPSGRTTSKRDATIYTVKPFGLLAVMVDCRTLENALHLHGHLQQHPAPGQTELVPAAQTVLVRFETARQAADFLAAPNLPQASGDVRTHGRTVTIPVVYDGQDLTDVAAHLGMSEQAVIYAHTTGRWSVAFAGFAPGFFTCTGTIMCWTFPAAPPRAPRFLPVLLAWPVTSRAFTRAPPRRLAAHWPHECASLGPHPEPTCPARARYAGAVRGGA